MINNKKNRVFIYLYSFLGSIILFLFLFFYPPSFFLTTKKRELSNQYKIGNIFWENLLEKNNSVFQKKIEYSSSLEMHTILTLLMNEWMNLVFTYSNNLIEGKVNHCAYNDTMVIVNCDLKKNNFNCATKEYIFMNNCLKTIKSIVSIGKIFFYNGNNPFSFNFLEPFFKEQSKRDFEKNYSNEYYSLLFIPLLYSATGNIIDNKFEKNIFQNNNFFKEYILFINDSCNSINFYKNIYRKNKKEQPFIFISLVESEQPFISFFQNKNNKLKKDKILLALNKISKDLNTLLFIPEEVSHNIAIKIPFCIGVLEVGVLKKNNFLEYIEKIISMLYFLTL